MENFRFSPINNLLIAPIQQEVDAQADTQELDSNMLKTMESALMQNTLTREWLKRAKKQVEVLRYQGIQR